MATNALIVHQIPGRVRLVVAEKRGDAAYFSDLSENFARLENVQSARANPTTGSVVLEFMGSINDLLQQARDVDLFLTLSGLKAEGQLASPSRSTASPSINLVSGREINRMYMIGCLLIVVGLIQTLRGELFPPALSVFWAAMEAFRIAEGTRGT